MSYLLNTMGRWMSEVREGEGSIPEWTRKNALKNLSDEDLSNAHDWLLLWGESIRHEKHRRNGGE